ncbi:MAG: cation:dicarboxylase symporter family transporter [Comamonadaceae bacterium]|nr:MAG: cation:dicarboxylase symporter family transporter [Comamonadaceae bacterium]
MGFLTRQSHSLLALLLCLLAGSVAGAYAPVLGVIGYVIAQIYLAVVSMAAIPLLVVATFFGLRQVMALPFPGRRMLMIAALAFALVALCAVLGLIAGWISAPGLQIDGNARAQLGAIVMRSGGDSDVEMRLWGDAAPAAIGQHLGASLLPDNFFRVLVEGNSLGVLSCALLFGFGFAALSRDQNPSLNNLFEAVYRALELIIARANILLPLVAFGMAAHVLSQADLATIRAMGSFIAQFTLMVLLLSTAAVLVVHRRGSLPLAQVLQHLKTPMLVSLVSSSSTASIPHTIEAMSARLGFSRGIIELVVPAASVFLRAGSALYYVLLALFVANLYERPLGAAELATICAGATVAAFVSAGNSSLSNVGYAGMVLSLLQLPVEAAMALFLAIDLICEGPRNLLTLLATCVLIALASAGLPSERAAGLQAEPAGPPRPLRFVMTRAHVAILAGSALLAALLIVLLGVGVGARQAQSHSAARADTLVSLAAPLPGVLR